MIDLIVERACAKITQLESTLARFAKVGRLNWLEDVVASTSGEGHPFPPAMNSLTGPAASGVVLLIEESRPAPRDPELSPQVLRVQLRKAARESATAGVFLIDDYVQLESLADLGDYPSLRRLLRSRGKTASEYRTDILTRYVDALDALRSQRRAAVFGSQRLGEAVAESLVLSGCSVAAFLDNSANKHGSRIGEVTVQPLSAIHDKQLPVIIATTRFTSSIVRQLEHAGFSYVIPYSVMSLVAPDRYPEEIPYIGIQQDFADNALNYLNLFITLSDDKSRRVLDGLISYRLDYDARRADAVADEYSRQYFDAELITYSGRDVFVDLGGYDGDTAEKFISYCNKAYSKVFVFEPDENLLRRAARRLEGFRDVELVPAGAYSRDGELRFAASGRTNGSISEAGELIVPVRRLDSAIEEVPTLIKMDIEGAEAEALAGAAGLLRSARPKLAIAAYHRAADLWRLIDVVRDINPDYRFYLRHYSETGLESVIYAV